MKEVLLFLKRHLNFSNFWFRNGVILLVISILTSHLFEPKNFPFNEGYQFPVLSVVTSFMVGVLVILIAYLNFNYFKRKYFKEKVNIQRLLHFLFSTLGCITVVYIFLYFGLNAWINGIGSYSLFYLFNGLVITLLLCTLGIFVLFSTDIYKLYKFTAIEGKLKVAVGTKLKLIPYEDIAFVYSEHKIAYIVQTDGRLVPTDFTLNEVEEKVSEHHFYRANRQIILNASSIEQVQAIENGKLSVLLKPEFSENKTKPINISRYKKQDFLNWLENKS